VFAHFIYRDWAVLTGRHAVYYLWSPRLLFQIALAIPGIKEWGRLLPVKKGACDVAEEIRENPNPCNRNSSLRRRFDQILCPCPAPPAPREYSNLGSFLHAYVEYNALTSLPYEPMDLRSQNIPEDHGPFCPCAISPPHIHYC